MNNAHLRYVPYCFKCQSVKFCIFFQYMNGPFPWTNPQDLKFCCIIFQKRNFLCKQLIARYYSRDYMCLVYFQAILVIKEYVTMHDPDLVFCVSFTEVYYERKSEVNG